MELAARRARAEIRVLQWGTYDTGKPRTRILRDGIGLAGASLDECHASVWEAIEDKSQVTGLMKRAGLLVRCLTRYPVLLWRFLRAPRPDIVLIGYPGVLDVILLAPLAHLRGVPLVWDMFMSLYDTIVFDRGLLRPKQWRARLLHRLEGFALRCANLVFLDTEAHARRIELMFGLPPRTCGAVWVGAEVEHFRAQETVATVARPAKPLRVLFYGQFIPLHGIGTIVEAARLMRDDAVEWTLIGRGQEAAAIRRMIAEDPLPKLRWIEWVEYGELKQWISGASVCLGIFGNSGKAACVIPNKVFQIVVAGRPLITRDGPAIREFLQHNPPCVNLVPAADSLALADAVREHARYSGSVVLTRCHGDIAGRIDARSIGKQFIELLSRRLSAQKEAG